MMSSHDRPYSSRRSPRTYGLLSDDGRLTLVLLGIQNLVRDPSPSQQLGEVLALLDADGADQDRLARR